MKKFIEGMVFAVFWVAIFWMMMGFVLAQDTTNNSTDTNSTNQTQDQNITNNQTNQTGNVTMNETDQNQTQNNTNVTMPPSNQTEMNETEDNETDDETDEMKTRHGAEMRLFQLERRINLAILHMEAVIDVVKNKSNVSNSSSIAELESIVSEMKILLDEAKNISSVNTKEAVQKFVEVKKDAITLIQKFRKIARDLLSHEDKRALKERFKQMEKDNFKDLKDKIHEKRRMLNAERARDMLRHLGVSDEEFLRSVEGGKIRDNEIRIKLREHFEDVDEDKREEIKKEIKEDFEEEREMHKKRMMEAREKEHEDKADRMMKRAEKVRRMEGKIEKNEDSREGSNRGRR